MKERYHYSYSDEQILEEARLLVLTTGASTYTVANQLNRPQSTVWHHMTHRLRDLDAELFLKVGIVLRKNYKGGGR